jgi:hypothetical protein
VPKSAKLSYNLKSAAPPSSMMEKLNVRLSKFGDASKALEEV